MTTTVDRRTILRGAALGAAVWAVPTVIAVPRAEAAQLNSRPAPTPRESKPPVPQMGPPLATGLPGTLPFTGQNIAREAEVAAAAVVAGAAVVALTRTPKREVT